MNNARFEAFSDGVFAFAITLLALGFVVAAPALADESLAFGGAAAPLAQLHRVCVEYFGHRDHVAEPPRPLPAGSSRRPFDGLLESFASRGNRLDSVRDNDARIVSDAIGLNLFLRRRPDDVRDVLQSHPPALGADADAFEPEVEKPAIDATIRGYRMGWLIYAGATLLALVLPIASFALYLAVVAYFLVPRGADSDHPLSARKW